MMKHYNLPHNHGQNINHVLEKMPEVDDFAIVARIFNQLGDGTRLRILWLLCHSTECVSNIGAAIDMSTAAVSHHLQVLKKHGLIVSRREGKEIYYTLADTKITNLLHKAVDDLFEVSCPTHDDKKDA